MSRSLMAPYRPPEPAPLDVGPNAEILGRAVAESVQKATLEEPLRLEKSARKARAVTPWVRWRRAGPRSAQL